MLTLSQGRRHPIEPSPCLGCNAVSTRKLDRGRLHALGECEVVRHEFVLGRVAVLQTVAFVHVFGNYGIRQHLPRTLLSRDFHHGRRLIFLSSFILAYPLLALPTGGPHPCVFTVKVQCFEKREFGF